MSSPTKQAHRAVNIAHALTQTAQRHSDELAVAYGTTRWTWRQLDQAVNALAAEMTRRGVRPGQCVLLDGPNHPEFIQALYAAWRIGAVVAPVNSRLHDTDLVKIGSVCHPVLIIGHTSTASHVTALQNAAAGEVSVLWLDSTGPDSIGDVDASTADAVPDYPVWNGDAAWYFFTSGTSGPAKAAVLTHDQLGFVVTNHLADLMPTTTHTHRSIVVAPLSHGAGVHMITQVPRGAATIIPRSVSLDPAEVWQLIESERVTSLFTVPTILKRLVDDPAAGTRDHSSLRYVVYAGAPMSSRDQEQAQQELGEVLVQYYGLAEVTGNITVLPPDAHHHQSPPGVEYGTCGFPRTGMQVSIQDETGSAVGILTAGEICVAGPAVFRGYLDNDQADAAAFRDGWFRTGDIGMFDKHGYLYITGRLSDMYISGGSNVHPRDIEEKILAHPAVQETLVLGMPDPTWGEIGVAVCVLYPGAETSADEIRTWLTSQMARYKVPRHIVFWDELPRSGNGKITRLTVRQQLKNAGWTAESGMTEKARS